MDKALEEAGIMMHLNIKKDADADARRDGEHAKDARRKVLKVSVAVGIVLLVVVAMGNRQDGVDTRQETESVRRYSNLGNALSQAVSVASDVVSAKPLTGVYYLPGKPSQCFILRARGYNTVNAGNGFEFEVSSGLSWLFVSGFGALATANPMTGWVYLFHDMTNSKKLNFFATSESMVIEHVTFWRRPTSAPWTCTGYPQKIALQHPNGHCQYMSWDPNTGGFAFYYYPQGGLASGGGVYDTSTNVGTAEGIFPDGSLDGPFTFNKRPNTNPQEWPLVRANGNMAVLFTQVASCPSEGYSTPQQIVSASAPAPSPPQNFGSYFSKCTTEVVDILGGGWRLVRRVGPSHQVWHPAADRLAGTQSYGTPSTDIADVTFSETFSQLSYNQFLLMTGDCANWVITSVNSLVGAYYTNANRVACATSVVPKTASTVQWFNRAGLPEDPLVTTWGSLSTTGDYYNMMVYAENNFAKGQVKTAVIPPRNGANVYIREKAVVDGNGC